jgi:hypothetical protein
MIRYFILCEKSNHQIAAKLVKDSGQNVLCLRAVHKCAALFRAVQDDIEEDEKYG